jgi:hypothetical protein
MDRDIKKITNRKILLIFFVAVILIAGGIFFAWKKWGNPENQPRIFEALVEVRGESAGDAIAVLPEGHEWSETEKTSYLILKLKITPEEAAQLTTAKTGNARAYRLKIETLNFNPNEIWKGQPFANKVFNNSLIEKKP